jgi:hypothetical protein
LKGIESSGFDVAGFFADMITSLLIRHAKAAGSRRTPKRRRRALAARQTRLPPGRRNWRRHYSEADAAKSAALVRKLAEIEQTLRLKDYNNAESRLKDLLKEYSGEPRIFFCLRKPPVGCNRRY